MKCGLLSAQMFGMKFVKIMDVLMELDTDCRDGCPFRPMRIAHLVPTVTIGNNSHISKHLMTVVRKKLLTG